MYAGMHTLSISPRESEISLVLNTKDLPSDGMNAQFRVCDFAFKLSPGLQFSNEKWSIGLRGVSIPTRLQNIDSSFQILILASGSVQVVNLSDACHLTPKSITDFLNQEIGSKTSYVTNIVFGVAASSLITCQVTAPAGVVPFMVGFTSNLCLLLGFDPNTLARPVALTTAKRLCNPYADFKFLEVKCSNAEPLSTAQAPPENVKYADTSIGFVQVSSNRGIDDVAPSLTDTCPCSVHTVSIPMENVVFYPLSAQNLFTVYFKLLSQSSQLVKVDTALPVVFRIILRKIDHSFV